MRKFLVMAAAMAATIVSFATTAQAQYQSGGAWNGPRGSGYYYNNGGNGQNQFWGAAAGGLVGGLLGSTVNRGYNGGYNGPPPYNGNPQVVIIQQAPPPVYTAQPEITYMPPAPPQTRQNFVLVGPAVVQNPGSVPRGPSALYWDSSVGLQCQMRPAQYNTPSGILQETQRFCQMPSGRWQRV